MLLHGISELKKMLIYKFNYPGDKKDEINQEIETVSNKALSKFHFYQIKIFKPFYVS